LQDRDSFNLDMGLRTKRTKGDSMRSGVVLLALLLCSCQLTSKKGNEFSEAQRFVEQMVAKHPEIVRLTIHAVPTGETRSRIIACNVYEKRGKPSDPEDLEVMKTKKTVVLREGNNLDVTAAILDKAGKAIAATGITLTFPSNTSQEALVKKAEEIAQELTGAIQAAGQPLW
jgi:hypothetical protein